MRLSFATAVLALLAGCGQPAPRKETPAPFEFTRMFVHWSEYLKPGYLDFVAAAQPELVQVGFYGADLYALGHMPDSAKGLSGPLFPIHGGAVQAVEPKDRLQANLTYFENLNREVHKRGAKVIGHFAMAKYLIGEKGGTARDGFFKFYTDLWDEKELGPKPVADPVQLLQRNADGTPIVTDDDDAGPYGVYYGCLNNPHWRTVLKAFARQGIRRGVDGFIINYFYRLNCLCEHCQREFRGYLKEHHSTAELSDKFGIGDIDKHRFTEIVSAHGDGNPTPLRVEMRRFSAVSNKKAFDDVFVSYGRSIKPDLILAQWLHAYQPVPTNDERMMLPGDLWSKGEDYIWYCVGKTEPTLQLRYIRSAGREKPYTVCHYEHVKIRASMAELAANGGSPMGMYLDFTDAAARDEFVRYFAFLKRYDAIYRANRSYAEAALLYPRSLIHEGQFTTAMPVFHDTGFRLLDQHVLFDVVPDDFSGTGDRYSRVVSASSKDLTAPEGLSRFEAPKTVRVSASKPAQGSEIDLHFVNYARQDKGKAARTAADENPTTVQDVKVDFALPPGSRAARVEVISPEQADPVVVAAGMSGARVRFTLPKFQVYSVARIHLTQ